MFSNLMTKQTTTAQPLVSIVFMSLESVFKRFLKLQLDYTLRTLKSRKLKEVRTNRRRPVSSIG